MSYKYFFDAWIYSCICLFLFFFWRLYLMLWKCVIYSFKANFSWIFFFETKLCYQLSLVSHAPFLVIFMTPRNESKNFYNKWLIYDSHLLNDSAKQDFICGTDILYMADELRATESAYGVWNMRIHGFVNSVIDFQFNKRW